MMISLEGKKFFKFNFKEVIDTWASIKKRHLFSYKKTFIVANKFELKNSIISL